MSIPDIWFMTGFDVDEKNESWCLMMQWCLTWLNYSVLEHPRRKTSRSLCMWNISDLDAYREKGNLAHIKQTKYNAFWSYDIGCFFNLFIFLLTLVAQREGRRKLDIQKYKLDKWLSQMLNAGAAELILGYTQLTELMVYGANHHQQC